MRKLAGVFVAGLATLIATQASSARRGGSSSTAALGTVRSQLPDPASAKFEGVRVSREAVCGTVEGKDERGAFTGRMLFVYVRPEAKAYILASDQRRDAANAAIEAYQKFCQR
jgi:hypothetical protein